MDGTDLSASYRASVAQGPNEAAGYLFVRVSERQMRLVSSAEYWPIRTTAEREESCGIID